MKDLTKWRQAVLTENDLTPAVGNSVKLGSKVNATIEQKYYPKKMRKEIKAQPLTSDLVAGFLQPIVYALNRGKTISPNSDAHSGKRVTQAEINRYRDAAYNEKSKSVNMEICEGCGRPANCWAHIIAQSECKNIGKTELIWYLGNFFRSCYDCNSAIENPKGVRWHGLKNIGYCLQFISEHDKELFAKFSTNGILEI